MPLPASAYIGPGAGLSAPGTFVALVGAFILLLAGFVWYPVKRLLRGRAANQAGATARPLRGRRRVRGLAPVGPPPTVAVT
jgi:hypothetical protein